MVNIRRHSIAISVLGSLLLTQTLACKPSQQQSDHSAPAPPTVKDKNEDRMTSLLEQASAMSVENYNPAHVVRAVNALQALGKEQALEQIDTYLANRQKRNPIDGLFWVLRVLFDLPEGQAFPPLRIGQPTTSPPPDEDKLPRFPIVMVRDIPFLAVSGYVLGGKAEPVQVHVAYYRTHGSLRESQLAPPASLDGLEEEFLQIWKAASGDVDTTPVLELIRAQAARQLGE